MIISPDSSVHSMPHVAEPSHTTMDFRETKEPALNLGLFILLYCTLCKKFKNQIEDNVIFIT